MKPETSHITQPRKSRAGPPLTGTGSLRPLAASRRRRDSLDVAGVPCCAAAGR
jgi:hypothetical protein